MSDVAIEACRQRARAGRKTTTRKIADTSDRQKATPSAGSGTSLIASPPVDQRSAAATTRSRPLSGERGATGPLTPACVWPPRSRRRPPRPPDPERDRDPPPERTPPRRAVLPASGKEGARCRSEGDTSALQ